MSELAEQIFRQATLMNEAAKLHTQIGRMQFAREVLGWVRNNAEHLGSARTEVLMAMCNRELNP